MSDETELNPKLRDEQAAIEAALRGVVLPESAIEHDSVMYQAGWAAAMAECKGAQQERPDTVLRRDAAATKFWPALAMTFAATTAACLMVILVPASEGDSTVATVVDPAQEETVVETVSQDSDGLAQIRKDAEVEVGSTASVARDSGGFGLAKLMSLPVGRIVAQRNALFEQHLAEAVSPSRVSSYQSRLDFEFEAPTPLTPRSIRSSSL